MTNTPTTLLQRALAQSMLRDKSAPSADEIELAIAFLQDRVSIKQAGAALYGDNSSGARNGRAVYRLMKCLIAAHRQGLIQVVTK